MVETNGEGKPRVLKHTTLANGSIKAWQRGIGELLYKLEQFVGSGVSWDKAGVEMISWYGKRRGSLQLAHLAGATYGFLTGMPAAGTVQFYTPKEVKSMSARFKPLKGFDEHQNDALSLCRLLVNAS